MSPLLTVQPWPMAASLFPSLCLGPTRKPKTPSARFPAFLLGRVHTEPGSTGKRLVLITEARSATPAH